MSRKILSTNDVFYRGDCLVSKNGKWSITYQHDGNFVLYNAVTGKPVWASDTWNSDANRVCMQADCNLVMYNEAGIPRWNTNTVRPGCNSCSLTLTDEGKLVLDRDGGEIWNSDMSQGMK